MTLFCYYFNPLSKFQRWRNLTQIIQASKMLALINHKNPGCNSRNIASSSTTRLFIAPRKSFYRTNSVDGEK